MRAVENKGKTWRWRGAVASVALLCALWAAAVASRNAAGAEGDGCSPTCVILIQVDGLEPKDVTPETTPYLWLLAHPRVQGQSLLGSALSQRSGFVWQAPRGVVSTGTAPATASLLTGGYPEKTGVAADDFIGPNSSGNAFARQRLGADGFGDTPHPESGSDRAEAIDSLGIDTLIGVVTQTGGKAGVFLGDPGLQNITEATSQGSPHWFPPGDENSASIAESQYTGNMALCPIPRYPDGGAQIPGQAQGYDYEHAFDPRRCPADDMTTAHKAASDLTLDDNRDVGFAFIHLAELGAAKRGLVDTDVDEPEGVDEDPDNGVIQPPEAIGNTDEAIGTFVERYAQDDPAKWEKTVVMVVGTHGYQTIPIANRVPNPELAADVTSDLTDYVEGFTASGVKPGDLRLVPNGTVGTIYHTDSSVDPEDRANALDAIKRNLEHGDEVNEGCALRNPALGACIRKVYYTDADTPDTEDTVAQKHETWRLDPRDPKTGARTRAAGDLVVELERGWALGRAVGIPYQAGVVGKPFVNPYETSYGGPQERAVAALVNGPSQGGAPGAVRDLDSLASAQLGVSQIKYFPVTRHPVDPSDPDNPPRVDDPSTWRCADTALDPGGLACANQPNEVGDDPEVGNDPNSDPDRHGHEAQPETVDFALTISALMQLPFEAHPDQLQGRVLQEAFLNKLNTVCVNDCEPEIVEEPPPPDPPPPPPPPVEVRQERGFDFFGLVRRVRARVVDSKGNAYTRAARGTKLSSIRLEGDFGRPESAVTLTFYRQLPANRRARRSGRLRLKAIVRFDPFLVKRGEVKITLKVPEVFKPSYVGITVREIARGRRARSSAAKPCTTLRTQKPVKFRCIGPSAGVLTRIVDANRLHKRKVSGRAKRRR